MEKWNDENTYEHDEKNDYAFIILFKSFSIHFIIKETYPIDYSLAN
ncbi:hypothetical protein H1Z61_16750 [Bacillus aquiflavi]|uniref:Uncharacterized protein n=1 Tax=Bacillus aquiflavi TaxID=2672567 RepID=A0A7W1X6U7_9BACI|nr:hypothetical protein [Bacillus aquiflavi]MBA4538730.1 hypothetical protein [Bacillus aquiflavi]